MNGVPHPSFAQPLFTERQLAEYLGKSERWLRDMRSRHLIPWIRIGGEVRYDREQISNWMQSKTRIARA